ncbi:MAG: hypothetical protein EPO55_00765 [Reyranella sp.]|uniref:Cas10/Cmr2 second palm domain-containing protein n=1 Tax=Reyranella sp. TaxID=1929291 RepID=UPI0011FFEFE6|nr:hypothetical protein [Reyranella sp.]TAJ42793.1 MAG: hypothetical protein EPO55_00765 [Reyranella sp.]
MARRAYLFEAKGIQRFVTAGGRLVDMVGASELADELARSDRRDLLASVLEIAAFNPSFSRRASAAFLCHFDKSESEAFDRFRALWRVAVQMHAPGLEFEERFGAAATDREAGGAAYDTSAGMRENSIAGLLPVAGPLAERVPRSGLATVEILRRGEESEPLDVVGARKRVREPQAGATSGLLARFGGKVALEEQWAWPVELDPETDREKRHFPFRGAARAVAVMHADVSGLGQMLQALQKGLESVPADRAIALQFEFSRTVETVIRAAAQAAVAGTLRPDDGDAFRRVPGRPILLGGDDLTSIVRADRALDFAEAFLTTLESESEAALAAFVKSHGSILGTTRLTACAGVAFVGASQPFSMAHEVAENLCRYSKERVKKGLVAGAPVPSAIAFQRVTSALPDERVSDAVEALTLREGNKILHRLTAQPYAVGGVASTRPSFAALRELRHWMDETRMGLGGLRRLRDIALSDANDAAAAYGRWRDVLSRTEGGRAETYAGALVKLGCAGAGFPLREDDAESPLFDALEWRAAEAA